MSQKQELEEALLRVPLITDVTPTSFGAWSVSKLKMLEKCPLQFFLKYCVKLVVVKEENPDDVLLRNTGTTLHRILELMFSGQTFAAAEQMAREENILAVTPERFDFVEKHYPNLKAFERRIGAFEENHPIASIDPELKIAVNRNYEPVSFFDETAYFRGVLDLPILLENGDVLILDHKRGGSPAYGLKYHLPQLSTYHLLYHFGHQRVRGSQAGIHFMEAGAVVMSSYTKGKNIEDLLPAWLDSKIETAVKTVTDQEKFAANKGTACTWCDYKALCKNGKRNTVGDLQPILDATGKLF